MTGTLLNVKESGTSPIHKKAVYGHGNYTSDITPSYGNTTKWTRSLDGGNKSGDISDNWSIEVDVGKTYLLITKIGTTSGFYPRGSLVLGHTFDVAQNSTASRAIWLKRHGAYTGDGKLWSSGSYSKINDYSWHGRNATYDSAFLNYLKDNNQYIKHIFFQFSTEGGSVSRKTQIKIRNFRFKWVDVPSGKTLILPKLRPYADRQDLNVIA
jgi:hypothetical protein